MLQNILRLIGDETILQNFVHEARKKLLAILKIIRYLEKIKGRIKGPCRMEGNGYFQVEGGDIFRNFLPQEEKSSY